MKTIKQRIQELSYNITTEAGEKLVVVELDDVIKVIENDLHLIEGNSYTFADYFSCWVEDGKVWMEQYSEGAFELKHIKTISEYAQLYKLLTGEDFNE